MVFIGLKPALLLYYCKNNIMKRVINCAIGSRVNDIIIILDGCLQILVMIVLVS